MTIQEIYDRLELDQDCELEPMGVRPLGVAPGAVPAASTGGAGLRFDRIESRFGSFVRQTFDGGTSAANWYRIVPGAGGAS